MDHVARETGVDRAEVRLRNFIPPEDFPHPQPSGAMLDCGDYPRRSRRVLEMVDYEGFRARQAAGARRGPAARAGHRPGADARGLRDAGRADDLRATTARTVRIAPAGEVTILTGVTSPGCGNETALAQIVADVLGVPLETGSASSRATPRSAPTASATTARGARCIGGSADAARGDQDLREKLLTVAGAMLEAAAGRPRGRRTAGSSSRARRDRGGRPSTRWRTRSTATRSARHGGRRARCSRRRATSGWATSTTSPRRRAASATIPPGRTARRGRVVEVDPETGYVKVLRYCLVEDAGHGHQPAARRREPPRRRSPRASAPRSTSRSPTTRTASSQTATLMDYTIPTAIEVPRLEIEHQETPSPFTPLGTKGVGRVRRRRARSGRSAARSRTRSRSWTCADRAAAHAAAVSGGRIQSAREARGSADRHDHRGDRVPRAARRSTRRCELLARARRRRQDPGRRHEPRPDHEPRPRPSDDPSISLNHVDGLDCDRRGRRRAADRRDRPPRTRRRAIPLIAAHAPLLAEAARSIGDVQVRNRGTLGGSVAHADPAADYLPVLVALGARSS